MVLLCSGQVAAFNPHVGEAAKNPRDVMAPGSSFFCDLQSLSLVNLCFRQITSVQSNIPELIENSCSANVAAGVLFLSG